MDTLTRLLDPTLLDLMVVMVVAIAISYLLGEIDGNHAPAARPTDRDGEAPSEPPATQKTAR